MTLRDILQTTKTESEDAFEKSRARPKVAQPALQKMGCRTWPCGMGLPLAVHPIRFAFASTNWALPTKPRARGLRALREY